MIVSLFSHGLFATNPPQQPPSFISLSLSPVTPCPAGPCTPAGAPDISHRPGCLACANTKIRAAPIEYPHVSPMKVTRSSVSANHS